MKNKKNINGFMLLLLSMMMLLSVTTLTAQTQPEQIDGVWQIATYDNLLWLSANHHNQPDNARYLQTANIVAPANTNFPPIGRGIAASGEDGPFRGHYDGNGYVIRNLTIERSDVEYVGLFGLLGRPSESGNNNANETIVENVGLVNARITNTYGGLDTYTGGIAGVLSNATIRNSFFIDGNLIVSSTTQNQKNAGGIVGHLWLDSIVENCYSSLNIDLNNTVQNPTVRLGGIVGRGVDGNTTIIRYCYSVVTESGDGGGRLFGGIIGGRFNTTVDGGNNIWERGLIDGPPRASGSTPDNTNSSEYYALQMKEKSSYIFTDTVWNFDTIWTIDPNRNFGYPYLQKFNNNEYILVTNAPGNFTAENQGNEDIYLSWEEPSQTDNISGFSGYNIYRRYLPVQSDPVSTRISPDDFVDTALTVTAEYEQYQEYYVVAIYDGKESAPRKITFARYDDSTLAVAPAGRGTQASPYLINNLENLRWVSERPANWRVNDTTLIHFRQTADIDSSETSNWERTGTDYPSGFFPIGYPMANRFVGVYDGNGHVISNIWITSSLTTSAGVFSFAGETATSTTIKNLGIENVAINVSADNTTPPMDVGGILGASNGGITVTIENSYTTGKITATTSRTTVPRLRLGGIAGVSGNINNSWSSVELKAELALGNTTTLNIGGIAGVSNATTISNSYFIGSIERNAAANFNIGGIAGSTALLAPVTNSYWADGITEKRIGNETENGVGALNSIEMRLRDSWDGWTFGANDTWYINANRNFGMPYLNIFAIKTEPQLTPTPVDFAYTFDYDSPMFSWTAPTAPALELEGYNIYRDLEFQEYVTTLSFTDEQLTGGDYDYHITAVYKEGESGPVYVNIVIPFDLSGLTDFGMVRVGVNSNKGTFSIVNTESKAITVKLSFDSDVDFKIDDVSGNGVTWEKDSNGIMIDPDETASVTVSFSTLVAGERNAILYVELVGEN